MWRHIFTTFMLNWSLVKSCATYHITDKSSILCQRPAYIRGKIALVHAFFSFKGINYVSCWMNHLHIQCMFPFQFWVGFLSFTVGTWWVLSERWTHICSAFLTPSAPLRPYDIVRLSRSLKLRLLKSLIGQYKAMFWLALYWLFSLRNFQRLFEGLQVSPRKIFGHYI